MSTTGQKVPGVTSTNGSGASWSNVGSPGSASSSDNTYCTAVCTRLTTGNNQSQDLYAQTFGFSIPTGSTINGVIVAVEKAQSGSAIRDTEVKLLNDSSSKIGSNYADTGTNWNGSDTVKTYGSSTDLWGATLTPAIVNSSNFGLTFSCFDTSATTTRNANIDQITMEVYYTPPASTLPGNFFQLF